MPPFLFPVVLELQRAARQAMSALEDGVSSLELTLVQMNVLVNIWFKPGMLAKDVAGASGLKASTLTGVIYRLKGAGLLERSVHPTDRRAVSLQLTREGKIRAAQANGEMNRYEKRLRATVTTEDMEAFRRVLLAIGR